MVLRKEPRENRTGQASEPLPKRINVYYGNDYLGIGLSKCRYRAYAKVTNLAIATIVHEGPTTHSFSERCEHAGEIVRYFLGHNGIAILQWSVNLIYEALIDHEDVDAPIALSDPYV